MGTSASESKEGIPVLLLKTKSTPNDGYEEQFSAVKEGHFFEPDFVPVLEHRFLDEGLSTVKRLLQSKQISCDSGATYGGLIFTSQRAVEAFAKLVEEGRCDEKWPHLQDIPIYTVGPATSRALRSIPQSPPLNIFGTETGNGEALAHYMLNHYKGWYQACERNPPILFLVGEQRRDIIPKTLMDPGLSYERRIQVDELVIYGTGVMESFEQDFTNSVRETQNRAARWVVVFSPTGCEAMLRALGVLDSVTGTASRTHLDANGKTYIATIGPTTRDYLRNKFGFEADVCAARPSPEGLEDGITTFMRDNAR
ncbi:Uroporphyrinogen-III synthase [Hyphodiscus hymeniophilus]|uniref:Uroporphyrinogen-III synthase n=1 Tax=Hyphodiscus hymeniophilus TaxID=353542 RepID=A0A9P6VFT5_9HELO|nr:Uroporphyrinogen-III synthase [Hyphodiscus hymeniophilus]